MKIIFLCGCLEPGKDGVGDYTRMLAQALVQRNCKVWVVSLFDKFVAREHTELQMMAGRGVDVLRIPACCAAAERFGALAALAGQFRPGIISLQFVPYAYNKRGLVHQLCRYLPHYMQEVRWHIMFHEVWIGLPRHTPLRHRIFGWAQRQLIRTLVKRLHPAIIHTNTVLYQNCLRAIGYPSQVLPLFSNIPVTRHPVARNKQGLVMVLFGSLHQHARVEHFVADASLFGRELAGSVVIRHIGRAGAAVQRWQQACAAHGIAFETLGEQPVEAISSLLQGATIGLSTTALPMICKSGTVAAMQAHGLPVICLADAWNTGFDAGALPPGIFFYQHNLQVFTNALAYMPLSTERSEVGYIASLFLDALIRLHPN